MSIYNNYGSTDRIANDTEIIVYFLLFQKLFSIFFYKANERVFFSVTNRNVKYFERKNHKSEWIGKTRLTTAVKDICSIVGQGGVA